MKRILFVRLSAIGDVVFASPLVSAARRAWPDAHIAWLVTPACAPLLRHHPDLDEVIEWPHAGLATLARRGRWLALGRELRALRRRLHERRFDVAFDLQGLLKSALPTRLSGAPERIGLGSVEGSAGLMTQVIQPPGPNDPIHARISSEYLHLAQAMGWPDEPFAPVIHIDRATAGRADALITSHGLGAGFAAFCPFTTRPQKHWLPERWAELARRVHAELGLPVALLGGPADRADGARLAAAAPEAIVDLTGQTGILDAAAMIARARLAVAVDTGLGHMGVAFGVPTLLLFGATRPYTETMSAAARVLWHALPCAPCRRRPTCGGDYTCMHLITVEAVLAAIGELPGFEP